MALVRDLLLALLGPAGIWFGWYLQRRDRTEERKQTKNAILREKAEQIYEELEKIPAEGASALADCMKWVAGNLPAPDPMRSLPTAGRLIALLQMYFPSSVEIVAKHMERRDYAIKIASDQFAAAIKDERPKAIQTTHLGLVATTVTMNHDFLNEVRKFMDTNTKNLF